MNPSPPPQRAPEKFAGLLFVILQYLLPHHLLSALMYRVARVEWPAFKNTLIRQIIQWFRVDMEEALEPDPTRYLHFNDFFTRALKPDARPIAESDSAVACPADGTLSQAGDIEDGRILQAKGHDYSLLELLGGDLEWCRRFEDGSFATIYLSPRDYHRVHMPLAGTLQKMVHVPGRLFSVNETTTRQVPRLFARNERVVSLFETEAGPMAVILVGAIFVSSIDTVWAGTVTPTSQQVSSWNYQPVKPGDPVTLEKGEEMGRFNMGSTVILLFTKDAVEWSDGLLPGQATRVGEEIALRLR